MSSTQCTGFLVSFKLSYNALQEPCDGCTRVEPLTPVISGALKEGNAIKGGWLQHLQVMRQDQHLLSVLCSAVKLWQPSQRHRLTGVSSRAVPQQAAFGMPCNSSDGRSKFAVVGPGGFTEKDSSLGLIMRVYFP